MFPAAGRKSAGARNSRAALLPSGSVAGISPRRGISAVRRSDEFHVRDSLLPLPTRCTCTCVFSLALKADITPRPESRGFTVSRERGWEGEGVGGTGDRHVLSLRGSFHFERGSRGELGGGREGKSLRNSMIFISSPRPRVRGSTRAADREIFIPVRVLVRYRFCSVPTLREAALCVCVCVCKYLARMYFLGARHVPIKSSRRVSRAK